MPKHPSISQARVICDAVKAKAVIVLALYDDRVAGVSYGETKQLCAESGYTLDCIVEAIEQGRIPIWTTRSAVNVNVEQGSEYD